jgi:transposase
LAPPSDDDHGCAWRDFALHLEKQMVEMKAEMEAKIAVLEQAFARRSEKKGKMPRVPRPPRIPQETADSRVQQALLRAERVVTEEKKVPVPYDQKRCTVCGGDSFRPVGDGKPSEVLHYVPGYFRRVVTRRETLACRCGGCVITAPAPERWSDKTRYASSFVAYLVVAKCLVVTPLYRLEQALLRTGMPVARSTMNTLCRRAGQKLDSLREPLFEAISQDFLVHVDETTFKLTSQTGKAFMWVFVGRQLTGYRFELTRGGAVPLDVLGSSAGTILCDDYRGYDPVAKKGRRVRCGCMAHARRKYFEVGDVPEAHEALGLIAGLYQVEHEAERLGVLGTDAHLELRRTYSRPLFIRLLLLARELRRAHGPKTLLGRAARYTWKNMVPLGRFLHDARIPLDNNPAENGLRIVALGRKNFLFVHSEESGKELALLYSLVVSCTRVGVNPVEYIADVLDRIDRTPKQKLRDLLPDRWKPPTAPPPPVDFDVIPDG